MSRPKDMTLEAWLHLLREGGRWDSSELGALFGVTPKQMHGVLSTMVTRGFVVRVDSGRRIGHKYGVTLGCKVPRGMTLRKLVEAGLVANDGRAQ